MVLRIDVCEVLFNGKHIGLAGGVGGVGAPNLVIHILRFCSQLKLVRPSSSTILENAVIDDVDDEHLNDDGGDDDDNRID